MLQCGSTYKGDHKTEESSRVGDGRGGRTGPGWSEQDGSWSGSINAVGHTELRAKALALPLGAV